MLVFVYFLYTFVIFVYYLWYWYTRCQNSNKEFCQLMPEIKLQLIITSTYIYYFIRLHYVVFIIHSSGFHIASRARESLVWERHAAVIRPPWHVNLKLYNAM